MFIKKRKTRKSVAVLVMTVFLFSFMSFVPGTNVALAAYPVSDQNITPTEYAGNTPHDVGYKLDQSGLNVNGTWETAYGSLEISTEDGSYFSWEFTSDPEGMYAVSAVYVKGGNGYNLYDYSGSGIDSDGNLASPLVGSGDQNVAQISHLCFDFEPLAEEEDPGSLEVTKEVYGLPDDPDFNVPTFEITVTGPSYPDGNTQEFTYPSDLSYEWIDLEPGDYQITEGDLPLGWSAEGLDKVTVVAGEKSTASVTNTYDEPDPTKGALKVTKIVDGDTPPDDSFFSITITRTSTTGDPYTDTQTFTYPDELEYTWTDLEPGEYEVTEGSLGSNWVSVVPDAAIVVAAGQTAIASVTNTYDEPDSDPDKGALSVTKYVYGALTSVPSFEIFITGPTPSIVTSSKTFNSENGYTQVWNDLDPGDYTITEVDPGPGWTTVYSSQNVTVVKDVTTYATVTNTYEYTPPDEKGDLEISKIVRRGDKDMEFEFYVELDGDAYVGDYSVGEDDRYTDDGTIELKHGETAVIEDLDVGTDYSVSEDEYRKYRTQSEGDEGTIDEDGNTAIFYNTRESSGGGGGSDNDNDREDEDEPIIVPDNPEPGAPPVIVPQPEPVIVPGEPIVAVPVIPALPKTGGYPISAASLGTLLLGLGIFLKRK